MSITKTGIRELSARYRDILRKCAYLNAIILMSAVAVPAMAADPITEHISDQTTQIHRFDADGGAYSIVDSTYTNNKNTDSNGMVAWLTGQSAGHGSDLSVSGTTATGNVSNIGGAIGVGTYGGTLSVSGSTFTGNHAISDGGAIGGYAGLNIANSTFTGNTAQLLDDGEGNYTVLPTNPTTPIGGGAVALGSVSSTSIGTITGTTFTENKSGINGGAIGTRMAVNENGTKNNNSGAKLDIEATFTGNEATQNGGAIYNTFYANNGLDKGDGVTVKGTFTGNTAGVNGGAIYNDGTADTTGNPGGVMTVRESTFTSNTATKQGGAIFNAGNMDLNGTFSENTAGTMGGAIYMNTKLADGTQSGGVANISNSQFTKNSATGEGSIGGAIFLHDGEMHISDTTFDSNEADYGGAIYTSSRNTVSLDIKDSTFKNNTAKGSGALGAMTNVSVSNTKFLNNHATEDEDGGGAVFVGAVANAQFSSSSLTDLVFDGNTSATRGGAISTRGTNANNSGAKLDILNASFSNNTAGTTGGAIDNYLYGSSNQTGSVYVGESILSNNTANQGGAVYNHGEKDAAGNFGNMMFVDSNFTDNMATGQGGAIFNAGDLVVAATTKDVVFSGNKANGVANDIYNTGTLNLTAAEDRTISLAGGIDGSAGKLNINGAGVVNMGGDLKNHTVAVNAGELHLSNGKADGSNLSGSSITVNNGATINTIDDKINNYTSQIALNTGAVVKGDVDFMNESADTYAAADGASSIKYALGNLIGSVGKGSKTIQVTADGVTVDASEAKFTSESGASITSTGTNNGRIIVKGFAGGLETAADESANVASIDYQLTEDEVITVEKSIQDNFVLNGAGVAADSKGVELADTLNVASGADLTLNNLKLAGTGALNNKSGATLRINDSQIKTNVNNAGIMYSDPTTYYGAVTNDAGATASFDGDTFASGSSLTNSGVVNLSGDMTFASGSTLTGNTGNVLNILNGTTAFGGTSSGNNVVLANGAKFTGTLTGGSLNTQNGIIDAITGVTSGTDLYLDANMKGSGTVDTLGSGSTGVIKSINLTASEYGTADSIKLAVGDATLAADAEITGAMNYYTKVEKDTSGNLVFSDKLVNQSMLKETAAAADYDNTASGLTAATIQGAIDENAGKIATKQAQLTNGTDNVSATVKTTIAATASASDTTLVTEKAIATALDTKIDKTAIATSLTSASTDNQVASAKATYDGLATKVNTDDLGNKTLNINAASLKVNDNDVLTTANVGPAYTGTTLADVNTYVATNTDKLANVGTTAALVTGLLNDKQDWASREFGYDTKTTDAKTILSGAGFTNQTTGDSDVGLVDAALQLKTEKFDKANIVTAWSETTSDEKVASEKLVKASLDAKQDTLIAGNGIDIAADGKTISAKAGNGTITVDSDGIKVGTIGFGNLDAAMMTDSSELAALLADLSTASDEKILTEKAVVTGIKGLFDAKEVWIGEELGYDTKTTDAKTILADAGFTNQTTGDSNLGLVDAALQLQEEKAGLADNNVFTGANTFKNDAGITIKNTAGTLTTALTAISDGSSGSLLNVSTGLKVNGNETVTGTLTIGAANEITGTADTLDMGDNSLTGITDIASAALTTNSTAKTVAIGGEGYTTTVTGDETVTGNETVSGTLTADGESKFGKDDSDVYALDVTSSAVTANKEIDAVAGVKFGSDDKVMTSVKQDAVAALDATGNDQKLVSATSVALTRQSINADAHTVLGDVYKIDEATQTVSYDNTAFANSKYMKDSTSVADAMMSLDQNLGYVEHRVHTLEKEMKGGFASVAAMSALAPNARATGNTQIALGTGIYRDHQGLAIGAYHYFNDNVLANIGASYGGDKSAMLRAGVTFGW